MFVSRSGGLQGRARGIQGPGGGQRTPKTFQNLWETYKNPLLEAPWPGESPDGPFWAIEPIRDCHMAIRHPGLRRTAWASAGCVAFKRLMAASRKFHSFQKESICGVNAAKPYELLGLGEMHFVFD